MSSTIVRPHVWTPRAVVSAIASTGAVLVTVGIGALALQRFAGVPVQTTIWYTSTILLPVIFISHAVVLRNHVLRAGEVLLDCGPIPTHKTNFRFGIPTLLMGIALLAVGAGSGDFETLATSLWVVVLGAYLLLLGVTRMQFRRHGLLVYGTLIRWHQLDREAVQAWLADHESSPYQRQAVDQILSDMNLPQTSAEQQATAG